MPSLATFTDPKNYHILCYGTLLGSNIFQTFLAGPLAYKALPRAQFSQLQQAIFPPYFSLQTALPLFLALSWPGIKIPVGVSAIGSDAVGILRIDSGWRGLLKEDHLWTALVPIGVIFATNLLNLLYLGPETTRVMKERKHQETRDGKKYHDPGPKSPEMERLNKAFGRLHGASASVNLLGLVSMLWYGLSLGQNL